MPTKGLTNPLLTEKDNDIPLLTEDTMDSDTDSVESSSSSSSSSVLSSANDDSADSAAEDDETTKSKSRSNNIRNVALAMAKRIARVPTNSLLMKTLPKVASSTATTLSSSSSSSSSSLSSSSSSSAARTVVPPVRTAIVDIARASFVTHVAGKTLPSTNPSSLEQNDETNDETKDNNHTTTKKKNSKRKRSSHLGTENDGSIGVIPLLSSSSITTSNPLPNLVHYNSTTGIGSGILTSSTTTVINGPQSSSSSSLATQKLHQALQRTVEVDTSLDKAPLVNQMTKRTRKEDKLTAGKLWFDMPAVKELTTELKRDLLILRNRSYLDPKHKYKTTKEDKEKGLPRFFQMGTIVEGPHERLGHSTRLTNKERKPTLVKALMADAAFQKYADRTIQMVHERSKGGGKGQFNQRKQQGSKGNKVSWYKDKKGTKGKRK